ncbi:4,5-DOPA dioxygenase extradiol [Hymenobacter aerilatus]|uniref:4,5-DOPA dioxygenase extradiol n=1 Tax=Hymenobacter aerilatus TaxID=2932251 RepID=A0A8T9T386_9BACT|nr:4,5-DOPA dioxygenase extradiol [Hymenobacter aerilatus]UOR06419.1 4,5-DOPA dioxygenase extradiol [Hymenobacter aerilatus]
MHRKGFLKMMAVLPFASAMNSLQDLHKTASTFQKTDKMPVLFVGHGSPMNALADNPFTQTLHQLGRDIRNRQPPRAVLVVSAHWLTRGTYVAVNERPETIHDFGGFPDELFAMQYPAPGAPDVAQEVLAALPDAHPTDEWGLDHGTWTVLHHLFPEADIPVFQLSIDYGRPLTFHAELARQLQFLRRRGVLVVGSGNIVHNLRQSMPHFMHNNPAPHAWAVEFDAWAKQKINQRDLLALAHYQQAGAAGPLAVPTPDHYIPMLYSLALAEADDDIRHAFEEVSFGGMSMRTFVVG